MNELGVLCRKELGRWAFLLVTIALVVGLLAPQSPAQTVTGQITGVVVDPSGAVIQGAKVTLTFPLTGQQREVVTGGGGEFFFPDLVPGAYEVSINRPGFQAYSQKDISLSASEKLSLHEIQLAVGNINTEITVTANQAHVETDSSEHANLVNSTQITDVTVKGRNYMSYVALLPGVTTGGQSDAPGWGNNGDNETINGGNNTVVVQLNGIASQDDGNNTLNAYLAPSADAISEIKVQTNVMNAEYGSRNGGTVNVIFKGGSKDFHGTLYDYERNNFFNANTYFNKNSGNAALAAHPAPYKFTNPGGTFGGPVLIPGTRFNKNRDKLFAFFSADLLSRNVPCSGGQCTNPSPGPALFTMPSMAERAGDFSGIASQPGVTLRCPGSATALTVAQAKNYGTTCGNSAAGLAILNMFPKPTCNSITDIAANENAGLNLPACTQAGQPTNAFNFQQLLTVQEPRSDYVLRGDYNLAKNELWTVNLIKDYQCTCNGDFLGGSGWPSQLLTDYKIHSSGASSNLVSTIRPNLINEFLVGTNRALQTVTPANAANLATQVRTNAGLGPTILPVLFPSASSTLGAGAQSQFANPDNLLPNISFGGSNLSNNPSTSVEGRWPFFGTDTHYNLQDDITWIKGAHAFKFGFYFEKVSRNGPSGGTGGGAFNGSINFGSQSTTINPLDTGFSYTNAYEGVFQSYQEQSDHPLGYDRWHSEEWFVQDTWKTTRRLTLDYGIRFAHLIPTFETVPASDFRPDVYNATGQAPLLLPCTVAGKRVAAYPNCAAPSYTTNQAAVGLFAPSNVSGVQPFQGMVAYGPRQGVMNTPPLNYGPRFGFAYDLTGDGKTALRGGFGMFYNVFGTVDTVGGLVLQPPPPNTTFPVASQASPATSRQELTFAPSVLNSSFGLMQSGGATTFIGPQNVTALPRNFKSPASYSINLGIQRDLGHGLLLDVQYVGEQNRHNVANYAAETLPYGIQFLCNDGSYSATGNTCASGFKYQDPTKGAGTILSNSFLVPYPGYTGIANNLANLNSNYNSLQSQVTKRFGRALTMNLAWTYSKIMAWTTNGAGSNDPICGQPLAVAGTCIPLSVAHAVDYNDNGNHTHNIVTNWTYNLPNSPFQNGVMKQALNGWVVSGIFTYVSGDPQNVTINAGGFNLTGGGGYGTRPNVVGGQSVYSSAGGAQYLNIGAFAAPPGGPGVCKGTAATCGFGNAGAFTFVGPPVNNWNISLFKDFRLGATESRKLEVRWETYNTFNHTQFTDPPNSSKTINLSGTGAIQTGPTSNNSTFGQFTSTQPARVMVLAAKLFF